MKIIAWNTQGCGTKKTKQHLDHIIKTEKPEILFLSETKSQRHFLKNLLTDFPNCYFVDPIGKAGGLAFSWVDGIHFEIVHSNTNMLNVLIKTNFYDNFWLLSTFYGNPYKHTKLESWKFLEDIRISHSSMSWVVIGDYN